MLTEWHEHPEQEVSVRDLHLAIMGQCSCVSTKWTLREKSLEKYKWTFIRFRIFPKIEPENTSGLFSGLTKLENTLNIRLLQECIPAEAIKLLLSRKRRILKTPVSLFDEEHIFPTVIFFHVVTGKLLGNPNKLRGITCD